MARQSSDGTWGVRVQGVHKSRKLKPSKLDLAVGDGRYGYRTRPAGEGVTRTESVVDGQAFDKSARQSVARHKKPGCRLVSSAQTRPVDGLVDLERATPGILEEVRRVAGKYRFRARKGQKPANQQ